MPRYRYFYAVCSFHVFEGFDYNQASILGTNAASKWAQELAELNLAKVAKPFYLGYKDAGLIGVSCVASDNHLDDFMWYTLHNIVSSMNASDLNSVRPSISWEDPEGFLTDVPL